MIIRDYNNGSDLSLDSVLIYPDSFSVYLYMPGYLNTNNPRNVVISPLKKILK